VKPRQVKWHPSFEGTRCTGYHFGSGGPILAHLYEKSAERRTRHDEGYFALVAARHPAAFDPSTPIWRLEFQVWRDGMKRFPLAPDLEGNDQEGDLDVAIAAERSAEELPRLATFPKHFARAEAVFQHLTAHWLRLTTPGRGNIASRWPTDPTW